MPTRLTRPGRVFCGAAQILVLAGLTSACGPSRKAQPAPSPTSPNADASSAGKPADAPRACQGNLRSGTWLEQTGPCVFTLALAAGEFVDVRVEQDGLDIHLSLLAPDGQGLRKSDRYNEADGAERLEAIAPTSGNYLVKLSHSGWPRHGRARVCLASAQPATVRDHQRAEAAALVEQSSPQALRRAQDLYTRWGDFELATLAAWRRGLAVDVATSRRAALLEALRLCRRTGNRLDEARLLAQLGNVEVDAGRDDAAERFFRRVLAFQQGCGDTPPDATARLGLGVLALNRHQYARALWLFNTAARLWQASGDREQEARARTHAGSAATWLGRFEDARAALVAAETLRREAFAGGIAASKEALEEHAAGMAWLGWVEDLSGHAAKAQEWRARAARLYTATGSTDGRAWSANIRAFNLRRSGRLVEARAAFEQALRLAAANRRARPLASWGSMEIEHPDGDRASGRRLLRQALELAIAAGDVDAQALCLRQLANAAAQDGDLQQAERLLAHAWDLIETLRTSGASASDMAQPDFFAARYEHAVARLDVGARRASREPGRGHEERTYLFMELSRARALRESLTPDRARPTGPRTAVEPESDAACTTSASTFAEPPRVASSVPRILPAPSLADIRSKLLDARTRLLMVTLPEPEDDPLSGSVMPCRVWIVSRERVQVVDAGPAKTVRDWAETLREEWPLSDELGPRERAAQAAWFLGAALLPASIRAELAGVQRLIVVSEGPLQYVPFGALALPREWDPEGSPWVTRFEITYAPSAAVLMDLRRRATQRRRAPKALAIVADPVFSKLDEDCDERGRRLPPTGPRASEQDDDLRRLCHSGLEAQQLRQLVPAADQRLELLRHEATRAGVLAAPLSSYRVVHLATHAFAPPEAPERNRLALARFDAQGQQLENTSLSADDVASLSLQADLVVLSACRTGLGRDVRSEGLRSLSQAFMAAGATQVLVSLWSVDDQATAKLMGHFYRGLARGKDAAAALREAQIELARGPDHSAPLYWAGFVLQGEGGRVDLRGQTAAGVTGLSRHRAR